MKPATPRIYIKSPYPYAILRRQFEANPRLRIEADNIEGEVPSGKSPTVVSMPKQ